jgi:hypothetical protein
VTGENTDWELRVTELWAAMDNYDEDAFVATMAALVDELPADNPAGLFERAASLDSTGHSDLAVPLYQQALDNGLSGVRRRRTIIQMASSLRNLGRATESVELLTTERAAGSDELDDAVTAFLALALVDTGREREAAAIALGALAPHLPRYQRSLGNYARLLVEPAEAE